MNDPEIMVLEYTPVLMGEHWTVTVNRADARLGVMYERHYSCYKYADGRKRTQWIAPGQYLALMTSGLDALFVWQKQKYRRDGQQGINCAVFRNESPVLSSALIIEAVEIGHRRWHGERLFTYVDPRKVKSSNPGCCFIKAGWRRCGESLSGLIIFDYFAAP